MAHVSSIMILAPYGSGSEIQTINEWLKNHYEERGTEISESVYFRALNADSKYIAGTKGFERVIYHGGFNYIDKNAFIELFCSLEWDDAMLIVLGEGDGQADIALGPYYRGGEFICHAHYDPNIKVLIGHKEIIPEKVTLIGKRHNIPNINSAIERIDDFCARELKRSNPNEENRISEELKQIINDYVNSLNGSYIGRFSCKSGAQQQMPRADMWVIDDSELKSESNI